MSVVDKECTVKSDISECDAFVDGVDIESPLKETVIHKATVSWYDKPQDQNATVSWYDKPKDQKDTISWYNKPQDHLQVKKRDIKEVIGSPPRTYTQDITPTSSPVKKKAAKAVTIMSQGSCS